MILDWALIAGVIGIVIGTFYAILHMVDDLIEFWRAYREEP